MTDNVAKLTKILLWVIIALSLFFALMLLIHSDDVTSVWIGNALQFSKILLILTIAAAVLTSLYIYIMVLFEKPKKALIKLIPFVLLGIIFLIAYSQASDVPLDMPNYDGDSNVPGPLKWSDVGLIMMYVLLGLAILSIIYTSIAKWFK